MKEINNSIQNIRERILQAKEELNYSYSGLEKSTGISSSSLQRYLTGETEKFPIEAIISLCNALGINAAVLLGWKKNEWDDTPADEEITLSGHTYVHVRYPDTKEVIDRFNQLTPENRVRFDAYLEGLLAGQEKPDA